MEKDYFESAKWPFASDATDGSVALTTRLTTFLSTPVEAHPRRQRPTPGDRCCGGHR